MSDLVERYLLLGLELGQHVDGLVDAYYGPAELAERAQTEGPVDPAALAAEAGALAELLTAEPFDDAQRTRWLRAQLAGCGTVARRLAGEEVPYADEVRRCYGVAPEPVPEDELAEAHRRIDELLPGPGPLAERFQAWRRSLELPRETVLPAFEAVAAELRGRARELVGLPEGEEVELDVAENEPWGAFNYYRGGLRSRVVVNVDVPVRAARVADMAAHEIYPGHHTEHACKEAGLVRGRGYLEEAIFLVGTPQCLVSEGIASIALAVLGPDAEEACARILAEHGCGYDVELARALRAPDGVLARLYDDVGVLLHERGASRGEALEHVLRWSLRPPEEAAKVLEFVTHPTWRAYTVTYSAGERLAAGFVGGDAARFRRLLSEQLTTADLL